MNIHEYQAKELLAHYGVHVPFGVVVNNLQDVDFIINNSFKIEGQVLVVKAQIHAGGRGKAGGVKVTKNKDDAIKEAKNMFGKILVTHQTSKDGQEIRKIYIEEGSNIDKEYYLSVVIDRATSKITFIASTEGGVEIEEVAEKSPEKIIKVSIDTSIGMQPFYGRKLAQMLGLDSELSKKMVKLMDQIYQAFIENDMSQLEVNPLVLTKEREFIILDAKINFDDNSLFKHKDIIAMRDEYEEDPLEIRASKSGLNYVKMDGEIGCMVNGAGLAMSTMDIIKLYGANPANFLDVGGGATKEKVTEAFKIILSDVNVKGILVNIFGGIMRCDIIAEGIISAAREVSLNIPLVVRLAGTNFEIGKQILDNSGLTIISADDLADAADKIVKAVR